jgi:hypothetical protein
MPTVDEYKKKYILADQCRVGVSDGSLAICLEQLGGVSNKPVITIERVNRPKKAAACLYLLLQRNLASNKG